MQLDTYKTGLLRELATDRAQAIYASTAAGHIVLKAFPSPLELVTFLQLARSSARKAELVVALIQAAQAKRDDCLGGVLFLGFYPALVRLACRLHAHRRPDDDETAIEATVAGAFFEAVHGFRANSQRNYAPMALFFATRRLAIRALRGDRSTEVTWEPDNIVDHAAPQVDPEQALICREVAPTFSHERVQLAVGKLGSRRARKMLELLGTLQEAAPLTKQVRRRMAGRSAEANRRTYLRIQRARHRLLRSVWLKRVRSELSAIHETLPLLEQQGWQ